MTMLDGQYGDKTPVRLEISAITPSLDGPQDAYSVAFHEDSACVFQHTYNVHDWPNLSHTWMLSIACAFQRASNLITDQLNFSLSSFPATPKEYNHIVLAPGIDWLQIILEGKKRRGDTKNPSVILVQLFLQSNFDTIDKNCRVQEEFVRFQFFCSVKDVEFFGHSLELECDAARRLRVKLDIPACDDYDENED